MPSTLNKEYLSCLILSSSKWDMLNGSWVLTQLVPLWAYRDLLYTQYTTQHPPIFYFPLYVHSGHSLCKIFPWSPKSGSVWVFVGYSVIFYPFRVEPNDFPTFFLLQFAKGWYLIGLKTIKGKYRNDGKILHTW